MKKYMVKKNKRGLLVLSASKTRKSMREQYLEEQRIAEEDEIYEEMRERYGYDDWELEDYTPTMEEIKVLQEILQKIREVK